MNVVLYPIQLKLILTIGYTFYICYVMSSVKTNNVFIEDFMIIEETDSNQAAIYYQQWHSNHLQSTFTKYPSFMSTKPESQLGFHLIQNVLRVLFSQVLTQFSIASVAPNASFIIDNYYVIISLKNLVFTTGHNCHSVTIQCLSLFSF